MAVKIAIPVYNARRKTFRIRPLCFVLVVTFLTAALGFTLLAVPQLLLSVSGKTGSARQEVLAKCFEKISFPAERLPRGGCEGYWGPLTGSPVKAADGAAAPVFPMPVKNVEPFCGQADFVAALRELESLARDDEDSGTAPIKIRLFRGLSSSRIDGALLGNQEFADHSWCADPPHATSDCRMFMCWTGDLRSHYIEKYNIVPSREFYSYVSTNSQLGEKRQ